MSPNTCYLSLRSVQQARTYLLGRRSQRVLSVLVGLGYHRYYGYAQVMDAGQQNRLIRQHLRTDRLLGVEFVPVGSVPEAVTDSSGHTSGQPSTSADDLTQAGWVSMPTLDRDEKRRLLDAIDVNEVRNCTKCGLCQSRTQTVFGQGDPAAGLMFIGEGPGQNEDEQGVPFVGRAGDMLNKQITALGLTREQVYIANVVKCRPPNNRAPTPTETQACWDYLLRQIETIQPQVIVTLGGPAAKLLLNITKGITAIRGTWHQFEGLVPAGPVIPIMPTFHPAYLLRAYTPENRRKVWSDLKKALDLLQGSDH